MSAVSTAPVATVTDLNRSFGDRRVLDDLDLKILDGEFVALIGRSGSGKSTLLRALGGLDDEIEGTVTVDGEVGVAFQDARLVPWKRVRDNVALGLRVSDPRRAAATALEEVGLTERANAWPLTLSGGEAQRASLARALAREPRLLLLDEPFGALDALTRITMHGLVLGLWERHRPAVLLVTHDVDEAIALADRVLVLADGRIAHESRIERRPSPRPRSPRTHRPPEPTPLGVGREHERQRMTNPHPHPRRIAAVLAALSLAAGVAACGSSSNSASSSVGASNAAASAPAASSSSAAPTTATTTQTVAGTQAGGKPLIVGDQAGTGAQALLEAAGLLHKLPFPVKFADFTSGPPILQALNAGSLDVGGVGNAPPVFAAAGGDDIKIVGALRNSTSDAGLLVPKGSTVTSISQLKGKKIAVAQGSSADYHLLATLTQAGLTPHDVQLVYLQPAQGLAAFSSGSVAAWDVWPPFVEQAEVLKGAKNIADGQGIANANYSYVVASKKAVSDPVLSKEITQYLTELNKAHQWANTHAAQWAKTWAAATGLPDSVMTKAAADSTQTPVVVNATITAAEQSLVGAFSKAGLIPKSYSFAPYVSTAFNGAVQ